MNTIKTAAIDRFIANRLTEPGAKRDSTISSATVNLELRTLKAAIRVAHEWGYLTEAPKFHMVKERGKLERYVTPEHFAAIYESCDAANRPVSSNYETADWWRAGHNCLPHRLAHRRTLEAAPR